MTERDITRKIFIRQCRLEHARGALGTALTGTGLESTLQQRIRQLKSEIHELRRRFWNKRRAVRADDCWTLTEKGCAALARQERQR